MLEVDIDDSTICDSVVILLIIMTESLFILLVVVNAKNYLIDVW